MAMLVITRWYIPYVSQPLGIYTPFPGSPGTSYTQVSASCRSTVLLRSDGSVVTCGDRGADMIPPLEDGTFYTQALLKSLTIVYGVLWWPP